MMRITVLAENTAGCDGVLAEHGLALFIEVADHTYLCDGGQSATLLQNAATLKKDLSAVEIAVLSHGHYDHSTGISALAKTYPLIPIAVREEAEGAYYHGERYIGIEPGLLSLPGARRITETGRTALSDALSVFSGFGDTFPRPFANEGLTVRDGDSERPDDFCHEQAAVVYEGERRVLISGCAHSGILNILARFSALYGGMPDAVFSGFHTAKPTPYSQAEITAVQALARELKKTGAAFFTGHCTGDEAFSLMQPILGDHLVRLRCGDEFVI